MAMNINSFFKKLFSDRKRVLEFFFPILLIIMGVTAYFIISQRNEGRVSYEADFRDQTFITALNQYRLGNLDRAELLFERALKETKFKKKKSLTELFLGNIYYKRELYEDAIRHYELAFAYNKRNTHALHNTALAYTRIGNIKEALSYAQKAYTMKKDRNINLLLLGNLYFSLGRFEEALSMYKQGSEPAEVFAYNRAVVYAKLGDIDASEGIFQSIADNREIRPADSSTALRGLSLIWFGLLKEREGGASTASIFERALEIFPSNDLVRYNLAVTLLEEQKYEKAADLLKTVGEETGRKSELLGYALYKSGRFMEALNHYNKMEKPENAAEYSYIIGDLYVKLGLLEQSRPFYKKALENPKYEGALINLFRVYVKEGLSEDAKRVCNEFMKANDEDPLPHILLADLLFQEGRESEARSYLGTAVDLSKNEISSLTRIAEVWEKYGHYNNALFLYHRILSIEPGHYEAMVRIAEIYLLTGHKQKARATLERAREMISEISEYYRASILIADSEESQNAISVYKTLINDFPYRYEAYYNLAILYLETEDYEGTVQIINQCMGNVPDLDSHALSNLHSILGVAHARLGHVLDAEKQFQEARKLDNTNEIPLINIRRVRSLSR
jgi:tetratricopeptide (TPR) repeat protein